MKIVFFFFLNESNKKSLFKTRNPLKEDNFSKEAYERVESDLLNLKSKSEALAPLNFSSSNSGPKFSLIEQKDSNIDLVYDDRDLNNFEALDDLDANMGYRLNKFKSKDVKK